MPRMSRTRLTRQERIKLGCAAVGGVMSGIARALVGWLIRQHS